MYLGRLTQQTQHSYMYHIEIIQRKTAQVYFFDNH